MAGARVFALATLLSLCMPAEAQDSVETTGSPTEEAIRHAAEEVAKNPALQHDRPKPEVDIDPPSFHLPIPAELVKLILIVAIVGALGFVLVHLVRTYAPSRSTTSKERIHEASARPIGIPGEAPLPDLDEIERLARARHYAEAIHLMLLHALDAVRRRLDVNWAKSLTSREIVRRSELAPTDRRALKILVGAVELSRFGGQGANEQIYRNCLEQYRLIGAGGGMAEA